ncbi:MAG: DNA primase [Treponema sp.]|jgi:DNA primase|nr:DNA primase [Treponema sp.]
MSFISETTIREVTAKADILSVVGEYVRLEKRGGRHWGLCPFHNEKTPSFSVDSGRNMYYCFGCHAGGGVITFVMEMEKASYPEAIESIAKQCGIEIIYENQSSSPKDDSRKKIQEDLEELYRRVAGSFHHILMEKSEGQKALRYILSRGIEKNMIQTFGLGYAPKDRSWLFHFLTKKGYSEDFLKTSGLFSKNNPQTSFYSDRLMFPIANKEGKNVAFGGRLLDGEGPKYINSAESDLYKKRETLFAIHLAIPEIRKTKEVYIAEGYLDVIALHQAGITNAVAPLGTAFTEEQAKLLRRWAERVYVIFDNDEAGQNATVKAILTCRNNALSCFVVNLHGNHENEGSEKLAAKDPADTQVPAETNNATQKKDPADTKVPADMNNATQKKDPADILKQDGPEALQKSVKCFITDFIYLLNRSKSLFDLASSDGKAEAASFLFPFLETIESEIARDEAIKTIADTFGIDRSAVKNDFGSRNMPKRTIVKSDVSNSSAPIRINEELYLLIAVFINNDLYQKFRSSLSMEEVEDSRAKEMFIALEEWFRNDSMGFDDLLARIEDELLKSFVLEKSASGAFSVNPEQIISDGIKRIKRKNLERRSNAIVLSLRSAKNEGLRINVEDLMAEKVHIDAELLRLKDMNE